MLSGILDFEELCSTDIWLYGGIQGYLKGSFQVPLMVSHSPVSTLS